LLIYLPLFPCIFFLFFKVRKYVLSYFVNTPSFLSLKLTYCKSSNVPPYAFYLLGSGKFFPYFLGSNLVLKGKPQKNLKGTFYLFLRSVFPPLFFSGGFLGVKLKVPFLKNFLTLFSGFLKFFF
jgi:hypothetical protein